MANDKQKKSQKTLSFKVASILSMCLMGAMIFLMAKSSITELAASYQLKRELKEAQAELETLNAQTESLKSEKEKLSNPEYVENYARGTHLLSKEDEQVFILPKSKP